MNTEHKALIVKFNDLYKKTLRVSNPEDLPLSELRSLIFEMIDILTDMVRLELIPNDMFMRWNATNKKGPFEVFLWRFSMTKATWGDFTGDPLPIWRAYQDSLIAFVKGATRYLTPAPEKFSWKGLTVYNPTAISSGVLNGALDALEEGLELLKRRGLEDALYANLKGVYFTREGYKFRGSGTGRDYMSAGHYTDKDKTITLVISQVDADRNARFIKRWFTELFLHELGHHIHLSYITREAKDFWDSGWEFVQKAKEKVYKATKIDLDDVVAFVKGLQAARWDFQAYGRKVKGFDRAKYLIWLYKKGFTTTVTQVRVTKNAQYVSKFSLDYDKGFVYDTTQELEEALDLFRIWGYPLKRNLPDFVRDYMDDGGGPLDDTAARAVAEYLKDELQTEFMRIRMDFAADMPLTIPPDLMGDLEGSDSGIQTAVDDALEALGIPSEYGKENFKEDFAETFVLFVAAPDRLSPTARWRMGRTLGISEAGGKKVLRLSKKIAMIYAMEVL